MRRTHTAARLSVWLEMAAVGVTAGAAACATAAASPPATQPSDSIPPIIVTLQKQAEDAQQVPLSATVVGGRQVQDAGIQHIKDASHFVPNLFIQEFTARKLSFPFVRGVGSGPPITPVTTYIDGVPQVHPSSASVELLDIDRLEFLRGPQGTLYGRNAMGGVINILTQPPPEAWTFGAHATYGNFDQQDYRVAVGGPLDDQRLFFQFTGGWSSRDGFTVNTATGNDLDSREGFYGRSTLLFRPVEDWEIRLTVHGERNRDGDFALGDLAAARANPHRVSRDFEGFTHRDVVGPSLTVSHFGAAVDFTSVTGYTWWETRDATDTDYTNNTVINFFGPIAATRGNHERQHQVTQEFRLSSAADAPVVLSPDMKLRWVAGVFGFASGYEQEVANSVNAAAAFAQIGFPLAFTSLITADRDEAGAGVFGQATLIAWDRWEFTAGLRYDYEYKEAELSSTSTLPFPGTAYSPEETYHQLSPRLAAAYHLATDVMVFAGVTRGYKAGGFNDADAAPSQLAYQEESTWNYELGVKSSWLEQRLQVNATVFYIDWEDLQLDVPNAADPTRFVKANAGNAISKGAELEILGRPLPWLEVFTGLGYTNAQFLAGSMALGGDVSGKATPFAPEFTWNAGVQVACQVVEGLRLYGRAEVIGVGDYAYDALNRAGQDAYFLANFRAGVRGQGWFVEGWIKNAFDEEYVPLALPYDPVVAPSGFIGEAGAPQTFGISGGIEF